MPDRSPLSRVRRINFNFGELVALQFREPVDLATAEMVVRRRKRRGNRGVLTIKWRRRLEKSAAAN